MLVLKRPRISQPQHAVSGNKSNPLARKLAVLVYPHARASFSALDGLPGTAPGLSNIETRVFRDGNALAWKDVLLSQYIDTPCPGAPQGYDGRGFTLYARFKLLGEANGAVPINFSTALSIFGVDVNGASNGLSIACGSGAGNIAAGLNLGSNRNTPDLALTIGVTYDAFLQCTSGQNAVLTVIGVATTVSTAATGVVNLSVTPTTAAKAVTGCRTNTSAPGSAALFVGALWWRNISDSERKQVSDNPWALLAEQRTYIPVSAAAGGPSLALSASPLAIDGTVSTAGNIGVGVGLSASPLAIDGTLAMAGNLGVGVGLSASPVALSGTMGTTGNIGVGINLSASQVAFAGVLTAAGNLQIGTSFSLSASAVALSGSATVSGDIQIAAAGQLNLSASQVALSGAVLIAGNLAYLVPALNISASPIALSGVATVAGALGIGTSFGLSASPIALAASAAAAGALGFGTSFNLSASPISIAGTVAVAGSITASTTAAAAAVWAYVLPNGKTAGQTLIENNEMLRIVLAAVSGKTAGIGGATETYFGSDGTTPRVIATFDALGNRVTVVTNGVA